MLGVATLLCALLALVLRLNAPAIQAANCLATPMQVALIFPLIRLGDRIFGWGPSQGFSAEAFLHGSAMKMLWSSGGLAGEALAAWLLLAVPTVLVMTFGLTAVLRRVPAMSPEVTGKNA